ncbi:two-component system C4-dicarboxylate transport sensor histidine kinase DctB [Herbaspirillum sp. Sphag1AN]|uniref:sensor histidine kinase n=1 Tax=unclassified Herbaspirillum TaxID=2624150 RepID=UPI0016089570|nr:MULTISPECIES: ATP-binding protein [unclassified Herbaspirillum]MBB3211618.1 two-component system C4-dicarboxylate transport sensor histidine kinase DctB [Herbaspirillum sp. Sphag1AN]MBB3245114.1 two-component system C4-dicarboxylate transport sensor histidine kinase DctB [Herbaspirillum sp. Sphag64]
MTSRKAILSLTAAALCAAVLFFAVYTIAASKARDDLYAAGSRQLQIIALDLQSILDKFESMPFVLGGLADVEQVLHHPDDLSAVKRLNHRLESISAQSHVLAIYMMDANGVTLAASNWREQTSFVGRDFAFRPYYKEALSGRLGRFYGIGNVSSAPGYFMAQPIYAAAASGTDKPIGVMVVKVDLSELERTWNSSEDPITLVDHSGVVFLSNRSDWKYHSLAPLATGLQEELAGTHQYADQRITPVGAMPPALRRGFGEHVMQQIDKQGWQLMLFPSQQRIARMAWLWSMWVGLVLVIAVLSLWAVHQRRRRLQERQESRHALQRIERELEATIAVRVQELRQANQALESKYSALQDTESLLRSTQSELVQAGKLAMLGQMAAGVTHELNQPLAAIRAFADNAVQFVRRGQLPQVEENLEHISNASARMGKIIAQLKGFARKSGDAIAVVDLPQAVDAAVLLLRNECQQQGIRIVVQVRSQVQVMGDAVRTEQVLVNLLRNAIDAIGLHNDADDKCIGIEIERDSEHLQTYALIRIRDTGPGIAAEVVPHLFEAFFTTKPSGKGLGLGLAISSSIVQAMNGQLSAQNLPQGGAEFTIRLPLSEQGMEK